MNVPSVVSEVSTDGFLDEFPECPWCHSDRLVVAHEQAPYRLRECESCSVMFVDPQPDDARLGASYPDAYYPTNADSPEVREHLHWKRFDLGRVWPHLPDLDSGRHLDVGCGIGGALVAARERGLEPLGIEFSEDAARFGRDHFGVDIRTGTLADVVLEPSSFSLITLYHALEHLRDPAADLERLTELLAPGGALVIECPNIRATSARMFGGKWFHLEVPRHLFHFHPDAVSARLESLGLQTVDCCGFHPAHGAASFYGSLYPAQSGLPILERARRKAVVTAMRAVARPLARFEAWLGTGSVFRVIARNDS